MALPAASHSRDLTDEQWLDRPDSSSLRDSAVSFVRRARDLMSTAPRDFEIPMLEGRGHAINFLTRYSAAFRLGPPRRHDRGDLGTDLARPRRRNLKVPCDLEGQGQRGRVVVLGDRRHEYPRLDVDGHRVQVIRRRKTPAVLSLVEAKRAFEAMMSMKKID